MTNFRIIGAVALSLVLAGPAMAAASSGSGMHRVHHKHYGRVVHTMPAQRMSAQDFDHLTSASLVQPILLGGEARITTVDTRAVLIRIWGQPGAD